MCVVEAVEVGSNPRSHLQHVPIAYSVGCWRDCCLCFGVRPELGKCGNSYCFLNFTLQSVLCAYNVSGLQAGVLLVLRRLYLLVHKLGDGLLCPDMLPPSSFSLLSPLPRLLQHSADVHGAPAAGTVPPGWHRRCLLSCFGPGSVYGRVPSLCAWPVTLDFIIPPACCLDTQTAR